MNKKAKNRDILGWASLFIAALSFLLSDIGLRDYLFNSANDYERPIPNPESVTDTTDKKPSRLGEQAIVEGQDQGTNRPYVGFSIPGNNPNVLSLLMNSPESTRVKALNWLIRRGVTDSVRIDHFHFLSEWERNHRAILRRSEYMRFMDMSPADRTVLRDEVVGKWLYPRFMWSRWIQIIVWGVIYLFVILCIKFFSIDNSYNKLIAASFFMFNEFALDWILWWLNLF